MSEAKQTDGQVPMAQQLEVITAERDTAVEARDQGIKDLADANTIIARLTEEAKTSLTLEDHTAKLEGAKTEARTEGEKDAREQVIARSEKFSPAFAVAHINDDDSTCVQTRLDEVQEENGKLRDKAAQAGLPGLDLDSQDEEMLDGAQPKTYDECRNALIKEGMSARDAANKAREQFPKKK